LTTEVRLLAGAGIFSPCRRIQTASGAHPSFYPMGTGGFSPGGTSM